MNAVVAADFEIPAAGDVQEVAPGILWLRMPLPFALDHINLYLLEDGDGWVVVDCGLFIPNTVEVWERVFEKYLGGKSVNKVIVTHAHVDHIGASGWLCEHFNAPLYMTQKEYDWVSGFLQEQAQFSGDVKAERQAFYHRLGMSEKESNKLIELSANFVGLFSPLPEQLNPLEDAQFITIGEHQWQVIVSEGHSVAHASLYCEALGLMISGDQVLPRISSNVSVGPHDPDGNPLLSWLTSLARLQALPAETLVLPAHNFPFWGLRKRLAELIEGHQVDLQKLVPACHEAKTIMQLVKVMYDRELTLFDLLLASGECLAHVHYLMHQGTLVRSISSDGCYLYKAA